MLLNFYEFADCHIQVVTSVQIWFWFGLAKMNVWICISFVN